MALQDWYPEWEQLEPGARAEAQEALQDSLARLVDSPAWAFLHRVAVARAETAQRRLNTINPRQVEAPRLQGEIRVIHFLLQTVMEETHGQR